MSLAKPISVEVMKLKHQLKYYLNETGMTAAQLARKSGVPKQSLSGWLTGNNPRNVMQVKKVADVLGVSVDNLLFSEGKEKTEKLTSLDSILDDQWVGGFFEVKLRRVKLK